MNYVFSGMVMVLYVQALVSAFRRGPDGPSWETRWWGLDSTGRERIADASYSNSRHSELTDPEETQLAKGYRRVKAAKLRTRPLTTVPDAAE